MWKRNAHEQMPGMLAAVKALEPVIENEVRRRLWAAEKARRARGGGMDMYRVERAMPGAAAERVQEWLDAHERPIAWLARQCDTSPANIYQILKGSRPVQLAWAEGIAEVTGIAVAELMPASAAVAS